ILQTQIWLTFPIAGNSTESPLNRGANAILRLTNLSGSYQIHLTHPWIDCVSALPHLPLSIRHPTDHRCANRISHSMSSKNENSRWQTRGSDALAGKFHLDSVA